MDHNESRYVNYNLATVELFALKYIRYSKIPQ